MNELIKNGRKRTILISISIVLVSIHTIYFYHAVRPEIETKKLVQQAIRLLLTIGLLIAVYKGKKWAKITSIILFSLALLSALIGLVTLESPIVVKIPLIVMIIIYSIAIYHFGFAKSYKAFFEYQNSGER
jgi:presenilin-like A22 family membrane protease